MLLRNVFVHHVDLSGSDLAESPSGYLATLRLKMGQVRIAVQGALLVLSWSSGRGPSY